MNCCDDYGRCTGEDHCAARADSPTEYVVPLLLITGSTPHLWYASLLGHLVPRGALTDDLYYRSAEPAGYTNFVQKAHATPVDVSVTVNELQVWPASAVKHLARRKTPADTCRPLASTRQPKKCAATCNRMGLCQSLKDCEQPRIGKAAQERKAVVPTTLCGQSKRWSAIEAATNIVVGFLISVGITAVLLPAFGHEVTLGQNLAMTSVFTVASLLRSYWLRRFFNKIGG